MNQAQEGQVPERNGFLSSKDGKSVDGSKWSRRKKVAICCSSFIVIIVLVVASTLTWFYRKPTLSANFHEWEKKFSSSTGDQKFKIDGNYTLVSFSDSYEEYLKAMGVPWFALPLILRGTETLEFETTEEGARQVISTGFMSREHQFKWNTEWNSTFGELLFNYLPFIETSIRSEEREKGWTLSSKMTFKPNGLINERIFNNKNITALKYYERVSEDDNRDQEDIEENTDDW